MNKKEYNAQSIKVLEGLEPVRKRPGMYIGSTDSNGLHHLVWEVVDNGIDEILAGYGNKISVTIENDGSITIEDTGRGVPVGKHANGKTAVEVVFTTLHAGGKFDGGSYSISGGLHGVGASIVTALSTKVVVEVFQNKKHYKIVFEDGGRKIGELKTIGKTTKRGTKVRFWPSSDVFKTTNFKYNVISERLREAAFLLKNIKIEIADKRVDKHEVFQFENGLEEFVAFLSENKKPISKIWSFSGKKENIEVEIAFQYVQNYSEINLSFVNNVKTPDGGSHVLGMRNAWTRAINEHARNMNYIKGKKKNLDGDTCREGLICIISVKIPEKILEFVGQTKDKLGTPIAKSVVEEIVDTNIKLWLMQNKAQSEKIIKKILLADKTKEAMKKARDQMRNLKNATQSRRVLSGKLSPAQKRDPQRNELYLVEGSSAGGSAKLGRDRKFQAILPLRGKVINAEKSKLEDLNRNEEIISIITAIGAGVGVDFTIKDCNYDKIIIMTDADTDGAHIQALLITFFYRYMKPLFEHKKIYVAMPPLFKIEKKDKHVYAWDEAEMREILRKWGKNVNIQRYKGLGEMNAPQLWETTMDPKTRTLIQIVSRSEAADERRISVLMGDNVAARRKWIEDNVEFTLVDEVGKIAIGDNQKGANNGQ